MGLHLMIVGVVADPQGTSALEAEQLPLANCDDVLQAARSRSPLLQAMNGDVDLPFELGAVKKMACGSGWR